MNIGPKSVLLGAHAYWLHPWFVAWAWWKLYGAPRDPRLWAAFFLHDLGYLTQNSPNMDGPEGERHPEWAAIAMTKMFDRRPRSWIACEMMGEPLLHDKKGYIYLGEWGQLCLYHSRFYSKRAGRPFSRLCVADKLAFALTPRWLYLPMVRATGEIHEYMRLAEQRTEAGEPKFAAQGQHRGSQELWFEQVKVYMARWVVAHKDGAEDTWTPVTAERTAETASGVWS